MIIVIKDAESVPDPQELQKHWGNSASITAYIAETKKFRLRRTNKFHHLSNKMRAYAKEGLFPMVIVLSTHLDPNHIPPYSMGKRWLYCKSLYKALRDRFFTSIVAQLPDDWWDEPPVVELVEKFIDSKLMVTTEDGFDIINEDEWLTTDNFIHSETLTSSVVRSIFSAPCWNCHETDDSVMQREVSYLGKKKQICWDCFTMFQTSH